MNKAITIFCLILFASAAFAQTPKSRPEKADTPTDIAIQSDVPRKTLDFKVVDPGVSVNISPVTAFPPQCATDGALFLDELDLRDLNSHTVVSIHGAKSQTYLLSDVSDLHDIHLWSFFPSDSIVGFLVRATRGLPSAPVPGRSPIGVSWSDYHNYVVEFDRDGSYKKSIQLPIFYSLSHLAIFPSGEFLVSGYDKLNSTARLLLLDSSGQIVRTLDMPASRSDPTNGAPYGSAASVMASSELMGSIMFTAYDQDILVWRMGSSDPVLDVSSGGREREVPLQVPPGYSFSDMIPTTDRWVAHFRSLNTKEGSPLSQAGYSYYEVRPEDGSISSKLIESGVVPLSIACEHRGVYLGFKRSDDGKLVVLKAE